MNISSIRWAVVLVALLAAAAAGQSQDEEEYDDAPAPAPAKPLRPSPLLRQARGPAIGRPAPKAATTAKPTTEAAPVEYEDEGGEEELSAIEEDGQTPTTTTEAPKKTGVRTGVVRPFRSNADLIETLKRRRQQQGSHAHSHSATSSTTAVPPTPASEKGYNKGGRRPPGGNKIAPAADQTGSTSERKSTVNGRRFSARGSNAPAPAPAEVTEDVEEQPRPTRLFGRSRRL